MSGPTGFGPAPGSAEPGAGPKPVGPDIGESP